MSKILRNNEMNKFIKMFHIKSDEEIFNIVLDTENLKCYINGSKVINLNKIQLGKYL